MPRRRGRPTGSSTDDYIIGIMCGLLWLLGPSDARYLAALSHQVGQVPRGGTEASRIDRLARKIRSGNFRANTKEWRAGIRLIMRAGLFEMNPPPAPPVLSHYDISDCISLADVMDLPRHRGGPKPKRWVSIEDMMKLARCRRGPKPR